MGGYCQFGQFYCGFLCCYCLNVCGSRHFIVLRQSQSCGLLQKVLPTLSFAFTSRSSAATIPLNIETQTAKLGNNNVIANFAASFGATIGQNGCGGIYPAMLAVMVAPMVGIDPFSFSYILTLIFVVAISSFGIAGVGGGATFAAIVVLSTLGLPLELVGLLISIEPIIDMGRTALNVNGAMVAGTITDRLLNK